ncbi:methanol oxidation system protein MoxJ [Derxia lacustris]|uniref:methanol oxidation system protein MoxJ n=1 Tax=Derxia lacustris TaxID=764842 RepID=UPI000A174FA5|nr:methanol oxidation system protein MoxJ [Derxia lacustris]
MKALLWTLLLCGGTALAQGRDESTLRLCAANDDLPYANARGEGFEDRIATLIARDLGKRLERVGFSDPRYVVRDLLDKGECDMLTGVDAGDPRLATTASYYRSDYVFITRADNPATVKNWDDDYLKTARIGVVPGTPAETMLVQIGRWADMFPYLMALGDNKAPRNRYVRYDTAKLVRDVGSGEIDVAVAWAPSVARFIKASDVPLRVVDVPDGARKSNGEAVQFSYDTAVGVRRGDTELRDRIDAVLRGRQTEIRELLRNEGLRIAPPEQGARLQPNAKDKQG